MTIDNREIKSFFFSQYFSDGLRIASGILLPALICLYFNQFETGITMALGALCVAAVDNPGPVVHKRNAMAIAAALVFIVTFVTAYARLNMWALGFEVTVFAFIFSMFTVYGNRAASVGTAALLVMVLSIDKDLALPQILPYSLTVLAGCLWYLVFSLIFFGIRPYRAAQQALGENIEDIVKFLRIKADFYLPDTDIDANYHKLVSQQIQVSQHQDNLRELLFKSRQVVKESTNASRILVLTFIDLIDMFESIMATHYDYEAIRERFKGSGILEEMAGMINAMANELENIGFAVLSNTRYKNLHDFIPELEDLKAKIDAIATDSQETSNLVLKKILINLRDLNKEIENIFNYYNSKSSKTLITTAHNIDHSRFITHQDFAPNIFFDNLSWKSSAFRHAARVSLVCLVGFVAAKLFALGHHSYWVLLTIIVILKPGYSLSKQRNYHRLFGTIAGGIVGVIILSYVKNNSIQFICMLLFMIGAYSFQRLNYIVAVIFTTPYVLILFKFLGVGGRAIVEERVVDTIIGSTIAFIASYWVFPSWESDQMKTTLAEMLNANVNFLIKIAEAITGKQVSTIDYKLARKDVFVKSANLSAMFERMTSEPKSKQHKIKDVHKFVVLNHILSSYTATVAGEVALKGLHNPTDDILRSVKKSIAILNESSKKLNGSRLDFSGEKVAPSTNADSSNVSYTLLKEQLGFINKISNDVARITDMIVA